MGKKLRKFNRATHRDLGYFFVAMIIIYSISGIAINHLDDWNPSYYINHWTVNIDAPLTKTTINKSEIKQLLNTWGVDNPYRKHYFPDESSCKIFVKNGNIIINLNSQKATIELMERRTFLHSVNWLHYNPNTIWKWFSDIFAVGLVLLAISGMFILRGKNGLKWRGTLLIGIGVLLPLIFLWMFYY